MTSGVPVDPSFSEAKAREQILRYLVDVLRYMPPQVSLSWRNLRYPDTVFGDAHNVPCVNDDTIANPPLNSNADYWMVGAPPGKTAEYFGLLVDAWKKMSWKTGVDSNGGSNSNVGRARTPDDYAFKAIDNGQGDLSISVSSPCFSHQNTGGQPLPETIAHPGS
ncbi:hypothetical protein GZH49_14760 [Nocardia terpenica]|uniref:hypothetical protein n=1 Tax=Nocardia terpenica TaxID=455432 RepID=UPI002FE2AFD6